MSGVGVRKRLGREKKTALAIPAAVRVNPLEGVETLNCYSRTEMTTLTSPHSEESKSGSSWWHNLHHV